jgi:hypothetical protein
MSLPFPGTRLRLIVIHRKQGRKSTFSIDWPFFDVIFYGNLSVLVVKEIHLGFEFQA